ncbi:(R)-specific enoyl-CoA hydratase [Novipirellula galeiformis]|uniref:(R)-specific enoyl-CoA hydratase n=2 Tax=Novipirellula galeiformis TaxID=2528004 RepID=A0A5C6CUI4_9BACT|nr:(R)-specific enoyl-CoA hydratase [Novipirellula galeiformis]
MNSRAASAMTKTAHKVFELQDCLEFAKISGDFNPLHVDPLESRRTVFGMPVVHGMHLVMQGLELLCSQTDRIRLESLKGSFLRPVVVGDKVTWTLTERGALQFRVTISTGAQVAFFDVLFQNDNRPSDSGNCVAKKADVAIRSRTFDEVETACGELRYPVDSNSLAERFPSAYQSIPVNQLCDLVTTSTLVGMECPGRHSLYSRFDFSFSPVAETCPKRAMAYQVIRADKRFRMATLSIKTPECTGEITAFVRPEPTRQLSFADACGLVGPEEFAGSSALVVGGSRGLGEVACKLLAAGGADVTLTFARGRSDALRMKEELCEAPGEITITQLNVRDLVLTDLKPPATSLDVYYFATPAISAGTGEFSTAKFQDFCGYYVYGVSELIHGLVRDGFQVQNLLCPSTAFLDTIPREMVEYAAAKAAAETVCKHLENRIDGLQVHCPRWPKLKTDQTAALVPEEFANAPSTVLESIRQIYQRK